MPCLNNNFQYGTSEKSYSSAAIEQSPHTFEAFPTYIKAITAFAIIIYVTAFIGVIFYTRKNRLGVNKPDKNYYNLEEKEMESLSSEVNINKKIPHPYITSNLSSVSECKKDEEIVFFEDL